MKSKIFGLLILVLLVVFACDFIDPGSADEAMLEADRDHALDGDFWEQKTTFPGDQRMDAVFFERDGLIYYGLGHHEDDNALLDMWTYEPEIELWLEITVYGHELRGDSSCVIYEYGGFVYIIEGFDVWEYDVDAGSITDTNLSFNSMPRYELTAAYTDSCVLFGSSDGSGYDYYSYYPGTGELEYSTPIDFEHELAYRSPAFFVIGDKIYTGGGEYPTEIEEVDDLWADDIETTAVLDFFEFDTSSKTWTAIPSLPEGAGKVRSGFAIDGTGYVIGKGDDYEVYYSWTPGDAEWTKNESMPSDLYDMGEVGDQLVVCDGAAYTIKGWVHLFDGWWPGNYSGVMYKYTP